MSIVYKKYMCCEYLSGWDRYDCFSRVKRGKTSVKDIEPQELEVIHRENQWIAINKPIDWMVHQGWEKGQPALTDLVRTLTERRVYPIHRLDRATSGVLLFALSQRMAKDLNGLFSSRAIRKRYLCVVHGEAPAQGMVDKPLTRRAGKRGRNDPLLHAKTWFRRICYVDSEEISLIEAVPVTGRQHQIRRHLRHIRFPLLGDKRYGYRRQYVKHRIEHGLARLGLHALSLSFVHPIDGHMQHVIAPIPQDLQTSLERMLIPASLWSWFEEIPDFTWLEALIEEEEAREEAEAKEEAELLSEEGEAKEED